MAKSPGKRITIRPSLKEGEDGRINNNWRRLFLDHLAETSNVTESAAKAGISASRAYQPGVQRARLAALRARNDVRSARHHDGQRCKAARQ